MLDFLSQLGVPVALTYLPFRLCSGMLPIVVLTMISLLVVVVVSQAVRPRAVVRRSPPGSGTKKKGDADSTTITDH
jgi:hypothetical protein